MRRTLKPFIRGVLLLALASCATPPLPSWVASPQAPPGQVVAVGFGQGTEEPRAIAMARRHALLQIVDSVFGERIRYRYHKGTVRNGRVDAATVRDFFDASSRGALVGQTVVHNEIERLSSGYVAYVMVAVRRADLESAYRKFLQAKKARRQILQAEMEGGALLSEGHYHRALVYYRRMVSRDPANDVWWIGVGASLYRLGRYQEALEATDRALLRNPRSFYGYWNRASIFEQMGRWAEGIADRAVACQIHPSVPCRDRLASDRRKERREFR